MPQSYTPEFKKKIVRLHIEEGRTYKGITADMEYQKQVFPSGVANSVKNAKTKPIQMKESKQNLIS